MTPRLASPPTLVFQYTGVCSRPSLDLFSVHPPTAQKTRKGPVLHRCLLLCELTLSSLSSTTTYDIRLYERCALELGVHHGYFPCAVCTARPATVCPLVTSSAQRCHCGVIRMAAYARLHLRLLHSSEKTEETARNCHACHPTQRAPAKVCML